MTVTHIVLCKFAPTTPEAEINALWADIEALKKVIHGMTDARFGTNISPEGLNQGHGHGFVITFVDGAARDAYLVHPDHTKAGGRLVAACEGGIAGITVVDI